MAGRRIGIDRIPPFEQFIPGRHGKNEKDRKQEQDHPRIDQAPTEQQFGAGKGIETDRKMRHPIVMVALETEQIANEIEGHSLECEVTAVGVRKN